MSITTYQDLMNNIRTAMNEVDTESIPDSQLIAAINDAIETVNILTRIKPFDFLLKSVEKLTLNNQIDVSDIKPNGIFKVMIDGITLSLRTYDRLNDDSAIVFNDDLMDNIPVKIYYTEKINPLENVNDNINITHPYVLNAIKQIAIYILKSQINEEVVEDKEKMKMATDILTGAMPVEKLPNK